MMTVSPNQDVQLKNVGIPDSVQKSVRSGVIQHEVEVAVRASRQTTFHLDKKASHSRNVHRQDGVKCFEHPVCARMSETTGEYVR